ncbi:hypothetical protein ACFYP4_22165 [Streptomyces sp. NPDC005551]|uniref:hypothetical protein n=1 Tax=Streptomyces sp. NPDC005551 TaxID=3364725 RepID=UPI00369E481F
MYHVIRSSAVASVSAMRPVTPWRSHQYTVGFGPRLTRVTSRIPATPSYRPRAWALRMASAREEST